MATSVDMIVIPSKSDTVKIATIPINGCGKIIQDTHQQ
jgi:hypothetical protein